MKPIIFQLFDSTDLVKSISDSLDLKLGQLEFRYFPDGETYLSIHENVKGRDVILIDSLDRPDHKILPLIFFAETARELGANKVGFVAPYLAYMRQDKRFNPGEGITSVYFSALFSNYFDWVITVDPHLHRRQSLSEIYSIPNQVIQAAPKVAEWIKANVEKPLIVGPDGESIHQVAEVASKAGCPYIILKKLRHSDVDVEVSEPDVEQYQDHVPILVDDIISTASTMIATVKHLQDASMKPPICIGVHAVFADTAYKELQATGVKAVITCNTIKHPSNKIDLTDPIVEVLKEFL